MNHSAVTSCPYHCTPDYEIINLNRYPVCYLQVTVKFNLFLVQKSFCPVISHCIIYTSIKNIVSIHGEFRAGINMSLK